MSLGSSSLDEVSTEEASEESEFDLTDPSSESSSEAGMVAYINLSMKCLSRNDCVVDVILLLSSSPSLLPSHFAASSWREE